MEHSNPDAGTVRIGPFDLDLRSGELRQDGRKIPLQDKPFRVLAVLSRRPGELVTREELHQQLWPGETFVDFEHGLNTAVKKLRQALEDSADSPRFVETLARRGYRLIAATEPAPSRPVVPAPTTVRLGRHRRWILVALAAIAAAAVLLTRTSSRPSGGRLAAGSASIAVLPFGNLSGNAEDEYLADGLTETLITELARVPGLLVISRNSAFQYKDRTHDLRRVGSELGVRHVLEGSLQREGGRLRVSAQLIDAESGFHLWAEKYDRPASDAFSLQDDISRSVRRALRARVKAVGAGRERAADTTPEAYDAYLRGLYRFRAVYPSVETARGEERDAAVAWFERAVALDPDFALARAMLSQAYANRYFYRDASRKWHERAFVEAEEALALEPDLAEGYLARADLSWTRANRFPHEATMADLRRAISLSPSLVAARWAAGRLYQHVGLFDRALDELEAARRVDPKALSIVDRRGQVQAFQRDYTAALESFDAAGTSGTTRVIALWGVDRRDEAEQAHAAFMRRNPEHEEGPSYHALLLARRGDHARAREEIARAMKLDRGNSHMHHAQYYIGAAYGVMGDEDKALEWLLRSAEEGFPCYPFFATDPDLAPLAGDPGFRAFLARLKARWERYRSVL